MKTDDPSETTQSFSPFTDPKLVREYLDSVLKQIDGFFTQACLRAKEHFVQRGWSLDSNLFAYEVRKDVFERLRALGADIEESGDEQTAGFSLERIALSGLLLKLPMVQLRIRKSRDHEIPPAGSEQLLGFYNWNLFAFEETGGQEPTPLHLVLLWNLDTDLRVSGYWLVCPQGEQDRQVKCYWQEYIQPAEEVVVGAEFRAAFEQANSDVPLSPRALSGIGSDHQTLTGTSDTK